jgi:hypothetical protein
MNVRYVQLEAAYCSYVANNFKRLGLFSEATPVYVIDPNAINADSSGPSSTVTPSFLNSQIQTFSSDYVIASNDMRYSEWLSNAWLTDVDGPTGSGTLQTFLENLKVFLSRSFNNTTVNPNGWDLNLVYAQLPNGDGDYLMPVFCYFGNSGGAMNLNLNEGNFTDSFSGIALDEGNFTDAFNGVSADEGSV